MAICSKYDSPGECSRSYSLFCKKDCEYRILTEAEKEFFANQEKNRSPVRDEPEKD